MKLLIFAISTVAAVSADVSHLGIAANAYNYGHPQPYILNVPIPAQHGAGQLSGPISAPASQYSLPVQHAPAHAPVFHAAASPQIPLSAPSSDYLPPAHEQIASLPAPAPQYSAPAPVPQYSAPAPALEYPAPAADGYHVSAPTPVHSEQLSSPIVPSNEYLPPQSVHEQIASLPAPAPQYNAPAPAPAPPPEYQADGYHVPAPAPVHAEQLPSSSYLPPQPVPLPVPEYQEDGYHVPASAPVHAEQLPAPIAGPSSEYLPPAERNPIEEISAPASETGGYHYNSPVGRFRFHF